MGAGQAGLSESILYPVIGGRSKQASHLSQKATPGAPGRKSPRRPYGKITFNSGYSEGSAIVSKETLEDWGWILSTPGDAGKMHLLGLRPHPPTQPSKKNKQQTAAKQSKTKKQEQNRRSKKENKQQTAAKTEQNKKTGAKQKEQKEGAKN